MLSLLCLLATATVISYLPSGEAWKSCSWTAYPKQNIGGGTEIKVGSLDECKSACANIETCKGIDFNVTTNGCWWHTQQEVKLENPDITHYDYDCQTIDPCEFQPCQNGATCVAAGPEGKEYQCNCPNGYSGKNCETFDPCWSSPCKNGGTCSAVGSNYQCSCLLGYSGTNCENYDPCASAPCYNGGACTSSGGNYQCSCPPNYYGSRCETFNPCGTSPCQNGGACSVVGDGYRCSCPPYYFGTNCETFNPCSSSPCLNGGACSTSGSTYKCTCSVLYFGTNCQFYNPCGINPCRNGGSCTPILPSGYQCACSVGYSGPTCEISGGGTSGGGGTGGGVSCFPSPCLNGGSCSVVSNGILCTCRPGFTGTKCEISGGSGAGRDLVSAIGDPRCFRTNYRGPITDFYSAPNGITWNFKIGTFGFDWPQSSFFGLAIGGVTYLNSLSFASSDNLDYFRVVFKTGSGQVITTNPIGPNDRSISLTNVRDVRRVDFYLAPVDFRRNVTVNDIYLETCGYLLLGLFPDCTLFKLLSNLLTIGSLGIIRPGGRAGSFSASLTPDYPFIDLDLSCAGYGTVTFSQVSFDRNSGFNTVAINVWDGGRVVPVYDRNGIFTTSFNVANGIYFSSSVRGSRIRATVIPNAVPNKGIEGSIWFSRYSVFAN